MKTLLHEQLLESNVYIIYNYVYNYIYMYIHFCKFLNSLLMKENILVNVFCLEILILMF